MINERDRLGELITANPARARVLDSFRLDYCCHGEQPLAEAAAEAGLSVEDIVDAMVDVDGGHVVPPAWADLGPAELIDHIVATHHTFLRSEGPRLLTLGRKVVELHAERHPELTRVLVDLDQLWGELEPHLDTEETVVFPRLRGDQAGEVDLARVRREHEALAELLDALRARTAGFTPPRDACARYEAFYAGLAELDADTRLHLHKESNVLLAPALVAL